MISHSSGGEKNSLFFVSLLFSGFLCVPPIPTDTDTFSQSIGTVFTSTIVTEIPKDVQSANNDVRPRR